MWRGMILGSAVLLVVPGCGSDSPETRGSETLVVVDSASPVTAETENQAALNDAGTVAGDGGAGDEMAGADGAVGDDVVNGGAGDADEIVVVGESICPTDVSEERLILAAVESYAREYSLSVEEARRLLVCLKSIKEVLWEIAELESSRLAGMGLFHGDDFGGKVILSGDEPPGQEAAQIADSIAEVKILTGARSTYEQLKAAQYRFISREWELQVVEDSGWTMSELQAMLYLVSFTGIDQRKNIFEIGIDPGHDLSRRDDSGSSWVSDDVLEETAAWMTDFLRDYIDVDFEVVDGRGL